MRTCSSSLEFFAFVFLGIIMFYKYSSVGSKYEKQKFEDINIDCSTILEGKSEATKYQTWRFSYKQVEKELVESEEICDLLNKHFLFERSPLSEEENNYPLAFGFLVHVNAIQVIMTLSILYQPQNHYCISVDNHADMNFKNALLKLTRCLPNVRVQLGEASGVGWNKMGTLNNVYDCLVDLTIPAKKWEYYQFVGSEDMPLKTNLEMVKILKALNGTINTEIHEFSDWRYGIRRAVEPPLTLYQGSMAVALPRAAADFIVESNKTKELLIYLEKTHVAHETFWATLAANRKEFPIPGSIYGEDLKTAQKFNAFNEEEYNETSTFSKSIASYEITKERNCSYCCFGIEDVPLLLKRPELMGHKFFLAEEPATYVCMIKELRRRTLQEDRQFTTKNYTLMPTVELGNGKKPDRLSRPQWLNIGKFPELFD